MHFASARCPAAKPPVRRGADPSATTDRTRRGARPPIAVGLRPAAARARRMPSGPSELARVIGGRYGLRLMVGTLRTTAPQVRDGLGFRTAAETAGGRRTVPEVGHQQRPGQLHGLAHMRVRSPTGRDDHEPTAGQAHRVTLRRDARHNGIGAPDGAGRGVEQRGSRERVDRADRGRGLDRASVRRRRQGSGGHLPERHVCRGIRRAPVARG